MGTTTETRITSTQAKDAIYKAHSIGSSASEIDGKANIQRNTIAIDGDSIVRQNTFEDSGSRLNQAGGYFIWANTLLGNKLNFVANNGVGGERTDQLLLRLQTTLDLKTKFVNINIGKNDISQAINIETIKANILEIVTKIKDNGSICVLNTIIPYGTYDAAQVENIYKVNSYIHYLQSVCDNLIVCDMYSALVDPNTDIARANLLSSDDVHPSVQGAYHMGKEFAEKIDKHLADIVVFQGGNGVLTEQVINNPYLLGATTVPQGEKANGWTFSVSNGVGVISKILRDNALEWQQIDMTTYGECNLQQSVFTNFVIGNKYKYVVEYEVDSSFTNIDFYKVEMQIKNQAGGTIYSARGLDIGNSTTIRFPQVATKGVIETPIFTIPTDTYRIIPYLRCKLEGKIRFGRTRLIKVD